MLELHYEFVLLFVLRGGLGLSSTLAVLVFRVSILKLVSNVLTIENKTAYVVAQIENPTQM